MLDRLALRTQKSGREELARRPAWGSAHPMTSSATTDPPAPLSAEVNGARVGTQTLRIDDIVVTLRREMRVPLARIADATATCASCCVVIYWRSNAGPAWSRSPRRRARAAGGRSSETGGSMICQTVRPPNGAVAVIPSRPSCLPLSLDLNGSDGRESRPSPISWRTAKLRRLRTFPQDGDGTSSSRRWSRLVIQSICIG